MDSMTRERITPQRLLRENRTRLRLTGRATEGIEGPAVEPHQLRMVAWRPDQLPGIHYLRVVEGEQWRQRDAESSAAWCAEMMVGEPFALIIADGAEPSGDEQRYFERAAIPLFTSPLPAERVQAELIYYQRALLGESLILHGVFLEVHGVGVVLSGEPGVGKSELALAMISRGHRFIADDSPEFWRNGDLLSGSCPAVLQDFIEVRGLGFLNIRALFGDSSIKLRKNLQLLIELKRMQPTELGQQNRALESFAYRDILGTRIPMITLPVTAGQQLAVLVETAVRVHIQRRQGYDSNRSFMDRQMQMMETK